MVNSVVTHCMALRVELHGCGQVVPLGCEGCTFWFYGMYFMVVRVVPHDCEKGETRQPHL